MKRNLFCQADRTINKQNKKNQKTVRMFKSVITLPLPHPQPVSTRLIIQSIPRCFPQLAGKTECKWQRTLDGSCSWFVSLWDNGDIITDPTGAILKVFSSSILGLYILDFSVQGDMGLTHACIRVYFSSHFFFKKQSLCL